MNSFIVDDEALLGLSSTCRMPTFVYEMNLGFLFVCLFVCVICGVL